MSECLAKQEQLVTFMLHANSFSLCIFQNISPTYAQVQRTPHMCKVFLRGSSPISCFHQTTASKCQSSLAINTKGSNTRRCLREKESWVDEWGYWPRTCCLQVTCFAVLTSLLRSFCSQLQWVPSLLKEKEHWKRVPAVFRTNAALKCQVHVHFFRLAWTLFQDSMDPMHWSGLSCSPCSDNGAMYFCLGTIGRTGVGWLVACLPDF